MSWHRPPVLWFTHLLMAAVALVCIPSAVFLRPVWELGRRDQLVLGVVAIAYALCFLWLVLRRARGAADGLWRILGAGSATAAPVLATVLVVQPDFPGSALWVALVLAMLFLVWAWKVRASQLPVAVTVCAILGVATQGVLATGYLDFMLRPPKREATLRGSALYDLAVVSYGRAFPRAEAQQGGISKFDDRFILVDGDGGLYLFRQVDDGQRLDVQPLAYRVPINRQAFQKAGGHTMGSRSWFRVADVLATPTAAGFRLFVSHHYWKEEEQCWVMRVSSLEGPRADLLGPSTALRWSTVFETSPCVPLAMAGEPARFSGINNGGRMVLVDENQLLVSIGDHEMDGYSTPIQASQDPASSYGKTVLVDLRTGTSEVYSLGHRNPQGMTIASDGTIWVTEHGPQGGDELNLVRRGANYGWPLKTYGTEYGTHAWPISERPGSHEQFARPFYSWVPSIGISNVVEVRNSQFDYWNGDLLVASLRGQALWRLRARENRIVMAEQIDFGKRIRDLEIGHGGELVLMADGGSVHFIVPSVDGETGEGAYRVCAGCHVGRKGGPPAVGPSLEGIVGRRVAAASGFEYSAAIRRLRGSWTLEQLDAFLASPTSVVPGTTMQFSGIRDSETRKKLIAYLASPNSPLDEIPRVDD